MGGTGRNAGSWTIQAFQYVGIELIVGAAGRLLVIVVVTEGMAAPTQFFLEVFIICCSIWDLCTQLLWQGLGRYLVAIKHMHCCALVMLGLQCQCGLVLREWLGFWLSWELGQDLCV